MPKTMANIAAANQHLCILFNKQLPFLPSTNLFMWPKSETLLFCKLSALSRVMSACNNSLSIGS